MLELRDAHRQKHPTSAVPTVGVGAIVLVHDQDHPRGFWKMAKVQKLITGRDGQTRGAVLKVANRNGKHATLQRPLQCIYPLRVTQSKAFDEPEAPDDAQNPELEEDCGTEPPCPQRNSAMKSHNRVRAWTSELMGDERDRLHSVRWQSSRGRMCETMDFELYRYDNYLLTVM